MNKILTSYGKEVLVNLFYVFIVVALSVIVIYDSKNLKDASLTNHIRTFLSHDYLEKTLLRYDNYYDVASLYELSGYEPIWHKNGVERDYAKAVSVILSESGEHGIYIVPENINVSSNSTKDEIALKDIETTSRVLQYLSSMLNGVTDANQELYGWYIDKKEIDVSKYLYTAVKNHNVIEALVSSQPRHEQYVLLLSLYDKYKSILTHKDHKVTRNLNENVILKLGDKSVWVEVLASKLQYFGDLNGNKKIKAVFDKDVFTALKRFQSRHGIDADGILGKDTIIELNKSIEERLKDIEVNLERWRWVPKDVGYEYAFVNVPSYTLSMIKGKDSIFDMKVIVGKPERPTPVMFTKIRNIEINPKWIVPRSIAIKDLLPKIKENSFFLEENSYELYEYWGLDKQRKISTNQSWDNYNESYFPFQLIKKPGKDNPLGNIKFIMPNEHDVYMHDTPSSALFARSTRAYSSGCIRLSRPYKLLKYILNDNDAEIYSELKQYIGNGKSIEIDDLPVGLNVFVGYFTVWVNNNHVVNFYKDIYSRNNEIYKKLEESRELHASEI